MKCFINGDIVDNGQKWSENDFTPDDLRGFIDGLEDGEPIELEISSFGGSCIAGNAIVAMLREASNKGHRTTAHVVSIAASMASVIACSCDELIVDSNAFIMVHLPWTTVEGNYEQMRKEADTLELFTKSLIAVYRTKFNLSDDEILKMLENETWILGADAETYGLKCSINQVEGELKVAAKCKYGYKKIPEVLNNMPEEEKNIEQVIEETPEVNAATEEVVEAKTVTFNDEVSEETSEEETSDDDIESLKSRIAELESENEALKKKEDVITIDFCEKRISGVQSSFQRKINDLTEQYNIKDKELLGYKDQVSNLTAKLEETKGELSKVVAALEEKSKALDMLNSAVNAPCETSKNDWRNLHGKEFFDYIRDNNIR